jgi:uncharacterized membrane protein
MMVLASIVAAYAAAVIVIPGFGPPFIGALRASVPVAVIAHLAGGLVAIAIGPWQLNGRLRARAIGAHRWLGRAYVVAVVAGGLGALALAPGSQEGAVTHVGFGLLAVLWLCSTLQAYRRIRAGDVPSHRRWMTRSYALTLAAVTLRIYLPLALAAGMSFHDAYQVISWLCWVPNLVVAEWLVLAQANRAVDVAAGRRAVT